jgi:hypothetical protein
MQRKLQKERKIVETCFLGRLSASVMQAVGQLPLCHDENSS